ncbi:MAG: hypothetical protein SGBAC_007703 [Bacillariaceae sp.]
MPAEATKSPSAEQINNGESQNDPKMSPNTKIDNNLKELDNLSYASSLSSTPILKLKEKTSKATKSNKSKSTKTTTKKIKKTTEKKASDSSTKKNKNKSPKVKKSGSLNGKNTSDKKGKSKSGRKSQLSNKTANMNTDDHPPMKVEDDKNSLPRKKAKQSSILEALPKHHTEQGSSPNTDGSRLKLEKTIPTPKSESVAAVATAAAAAAADNNDGSMTNMQHMNKKTKSMKINTSIGDKGENEDSKADDEEEEEEAACYLCHCGVDCSDRALFFAKDRKKEISESDQDQEYYFGLEDPYLPQEMYDPHNALVYCDSCDRMYHQKCHFVPILKLPQGDWNCLICSMVKTNQLPVKNDPKTFFASPPDPSCKHVERKFEFDTKTEKAKLWQKQLKSVKTFLSSQVSNIRLATAALDTFTSTKKNRAMILSNRRKSQELAQTLLRMTTGKHKIRQTLQSLESLRVSPCTNSLDPSKVEQWCKGNPKHACHVVPHGIGHFLNDRRAIPRTAEMKLDQERKRKMQQEEKVSKKDGVDVTIPYEILCSSPSSEQKEEQSATRNSNDKSKNSSSMPPPKKEQSIVSSDNKNANANGDDDDDDDNSGITLDDLQCCICMVGDATDDNDLILCDGEGCYRAFHMKCIHPEIKPQDLEDEDEDWFCPLCAATANYTHGIYDALRDGGEEEESDDDDDDDDEEDEEEKDKLKDTEEWDTPDDAFPNSQWEYETAVKYSQGKQNEDTNELLALYLGDDLVGTKKATIPVGSDSEDENDYSLFDEDSFAERMKKEPNDEEDEEDESDRSSQATWLSSSIENIDKDELNALSEVEDSDSDESSSDSGSNTRRRSRRLRSTEGADQSQLQVGVDFDEGNIVEGKRRRKAVDYRKLNDALFGKLTEKEKANLDDGADYGTKTSTKRKSVGGKGNNKKRAKSRNSADSTNSTKIGDDSTTTKQSESPSKSGSMEAFVANQNDEEPDSENDSASGDRSNTKNDSDSIGESGSDNDSNSEGE